MNSELMNILVSSALSGLFVGLVVWAVASQWADRLVTAAREDGARQGFSEALVSQEFLRRLREAREVGVSIAYEEMGERQKQGEKAAYERGVSDGMASEVNLSANHASDLVAARAAGFKDGKSMNDMEAYEAGYRDGEKQGYREGHEAADEANAIAVTGMVDALGGVSMDAIDNTLKAMNFPECLGVQTIKLTPEMKEAMDNPGMTVVIDSTGSEPVVRIEPRKKVAKPKPVKPEPSKKKTTVKKKAPVAPVDPPCCDPCVPCKPKRRSR